MNDGTDEQVSLPKEGEITPNFASSLSPLRIDLLICLGSLSKEVLRQLHSGPGHCREKGETGLESANVQVRERK